MKWSRVKALCRKEMYQITRDSSSILMAFVMPIVLLFIFGYGVNLDSTKTPIALVIHESTTTTRSLTNTLAYNPSFAVTMVQTSREAQHMLQRGLVRAVVELDNDFSRQVAQGKQPSVLVMTDGSLPNTANSVAADLNAAISIWFKQWTQQQGKSLRPPIRIESRAWFNPSTESRNFLIPGSIVIIMTVLGALLTSLVIAREWERGTMESLLAARITRGELLLSKLLPYYGLAIIAMLTCMIVAVLFMGVPFRGSVLALWAVTTLFLGGTLGLGLLISTQTKNQFNAAQAALNIAYMPAVMLSGFVYEIASMPTVIQWFANVLPARYFVSSVQTLFQAGNTWSVLLPNIAFLGITAVIFIGITYRKTRETLE